MNQAQPKTSLLAIFALVFAFLCFPVGLVLAIIALVRIGNSNGQLGGKGLAIAALVIPLAMVPVMGILSAIAIPNFVRFQQRSKQTEVKSLLGSISTSQKAFEAEYKFFVPAALTPSSEPTAMKEPWEARPCANDCNGQNRAACTELSCAGFEAPMPVYYRYGCSTNAGGDGVACAALGDLDGDGTPSIFLLMIKGGADALAEPLPSQVIAACSGVFKQGEVVDCTPGEL